MKVLVPDKLKRLLKGPPQVSLPYEIPSGYCFILPTRFGIIFGCILAAVLVAGINYNNNLAFALGFVLAAMGLISAVHTHAQVKGVRVYSIEASPVFAGQNMMYIVQLGSPQKDRVQINIQISAGEYRGVDLLSDGNSRVELSTPARRRGWHPVSPHFGFSSDYPFGLCIAWHRICFAHTTLVYPAQYSPHEEVLLCYARAMSAGGLATPEEFSGIREYVPGDRMQIIAWKASAKGTGLRSKEFSGEEGRILEFSWFGLGLEDVEDKLSMLTSLVLEAEDRGHGYAIALPDIYLGPGRGTEFMLYCLRTLAAYPV